MSSMSPPILFPNPRLTLHLMQLLEYIMLLVVAPLFGPLVPVFLAQLPVELS